MALSDDIKNLPTNVSDGNSGHTGNHQVIHAALKDNLGRLDFINSLNAESLKIKKDTSFGERLFIGDYMVYGKTDYVDITEYLSIPPNSGSLKIRRQDNSIVFNFNYLSYSPGVITKVKLMPGWRTFTNEAELLRDSSGNMAGNMRMAYRGDLTIESKTAQAIVGKISLVSDIKEWPKEGEVAEVNVA